MSFVRIQKTLRTWKWGCWTSDSVAASVMKVRVACCILGTSNAAKCRNGENVYKVSWSWHECWSGLLQCHKILLRLVRAFGFHQISGRMTKGSGMAKRWLDCLEHKHTGSRARESYSLYSAGGEENAKIHRRNSKLGQGYTDKLAGVILLQHTTGEFTTPSPP